MQAYAEKWAEIPQRQLLTGTLLPYLGENLVLQVHTAKPGHKLMATRQGTTLHIWEGAGTLRPQIIQWYREQAREYFIATTSILTAQLGCPPARVRVSSARTRWGSCSGRRVLSFTWRLLLGPQQVARYVAAHEVAHLKHSNHTPSFWRQLLELQPSYYVERAWLKERGHTLVL